MQLHNKNILVTGADGFIGSHLVETLHQQGSHNIKALSQYNSFNNWGWLESVDCLNDIEVITGDIRDAHFCKNLTKNVDIIFHLAALIAIPYSYAAPECYVDTNIKGTLNLCQAAIDNDCQRIIHTSTSEVYGSAQYVPINEQHPLQAQSPYSASKIAADAMAMSFYNSFQLPLTIARPFNTFGPRQSARAVIPTIITQIANNVPTIKLGDVSPTRDFNYVKDTCSGFIALANSEATIGQTVNMGSGKEYSIAYVLNLIKEIMNSQVEFITEEQRLRPEKSEVQRLCCDNSKMQELTGFQAQYTLQQGLEKTIEWLVQPENLSKYKANIYNV